MGESNKIKLLICTQKVNMNDSVLGFFHEWIKKIAKHCDQLTVICLEKGDYELPENVNVLSLDKEKKVGKFKYILKFYKYLWRYRKDYNAVFVHMNKEYVFLGGIIWRITKKRVAFWYNHVYGDLMASISGLLANSICYTSGFSFFRKWKKSIKMPVGINTDLFNIDSSVIKKENSLLFLGRVSKVKNIHILIEVLKNINKKGINFHLDIVGGKKDGEEEYFTGVKKQAESLVENGKISFLGEIPNHKLSQIYNENQIFINLTNSGSLDKTIFEAMASGNLILVSNKNLEEHISKNLLFKEDNQEDLENKIIHLLNLSELEKDEMRKDLRKVVVERHGLDELVDKLIKLL
jgi:glycosyltransferase involved in cell wall biosynthesis